MSSGSAPLEAGLAAKEKELRALLGRMKRVLVAFSGGLDSSFLLKTASETLGEGVLAVVAASEIHPPAEVEGALKLAEEWGVRCRLIHTREMDDSAFTANGPERCYVCKRGLYSRLKVIADEEHIPFVVDGQNLDDLEDYRPGSRAAGELGVRSPLREARVTKNDIRELSRASGLPTWDKPALACLASRFPYHTAIDRESLGRVAGAEDHLRKLGLGQVRLRHHGDVARIECDPADFRRIMEEPLRQGIVRRLKELGYLYVALDLEGYRSGSLNDALKTRIWEGTAGERGNDEAA